MARELIETGTAAGGMRAKLEAALSALAGGVERVRVGNVTAIDNFVGGTLLTD
jgi:acetylglutamate kinase